MGLQQWWPPRGRIIVGELTQVLGKSTTGGSSDEDIYYLLGLDVMGQQVNGNWDYFAYDGLGSVRGLMDGGGALNYSASYDPYGELMSASSGTGGSNLGFTGEYTIRFVRHLRYGS